MTQMLDIESQVCNPFHGRFSLPSKRRRQAGNPERNVSQDNKMPNSGLDFVEVGQHYTFAKTVGETDVVLFAGITGDFSDNHINDQYMREKSNLGGRIAHGALLV